MYVESERAKHPGLPLETSLSLAVWSDTMKPPSCPAVFDRLVVAHDVKNEIYTDSTELYRDTQFNEEPEPIFFRPLLPWGYVNPGTHREDVCSQM